MNITKITNIVRDRKQGNARLDSGVGVGVGVLTRWNACFGNPQSYFPNRKVL